MSIRSTARKAAGKTKNRRAYLDKFRKDSHRLIGLGFDAIQPQGLAGTKEEVITQRLVTAINGLIEAANAPRWMDRYHATDNLPVEFPGREGKNRPRVDVEVYYSRRGVCPRYHFEAKRLGRGNPVSAYLGTDGLGCFLSAQYARTSDEGGMLGYVQRDTCSDWASKVEKKFTSAPKSYEVVAGTQWGPTTIARELTYCYKTQHNRQSLGRAITVYHTFLKCC